VNVIVIVPFNWPDAGASIAAKFILPPAATLIGTVGTLVIRVPLSEAALPESFLKPDAVPSTEMAVIVIAPPVAFCNERETLSAPPVETTLPPLTIICLLSELKFTLAEEGDTTKISTPIMVTTSKNAQP